MTDRTALLDQLEALREARRSGASSLSYEGKSVTYRSDAEIAAAIAALENELGLTQPVRTVVVRSTKGW